MLRNVHWHLIQSLLKSMWVILDFWLVGGLLVFYLTTGEGPYRNHHHLGLNSQVSTPPCFLCQSLGCLMLQFQRRTIAV